MGGAGARPKRVLIVDDEVNLLQLYREELELDGYDVSTASSAQEGVRLAVSWSPDVVVMDIRMPGMDGVEAMGRMLSARRDLPIILNTAFSSYKDDFRAWPANAYVVKSSDLRELKQAVRQLVTPARAAGAAGRE